MSKNAQFKVRRHSAGRVERTAEELAELRAVREQFQRDKPGLDQVLDSVGQAEATTLGEYLHARELLLALGQERARLGITLIDLAQRTGCDAAVLSRLLTARQANPTLATVGRVARALGKSVVLTLRDDAAADLDAKNSVTKKAARSGIEKVTSRAKQKLQQREQGSSRR